MGTANRPPRQTVRARRLRLGWLLLMLPGLSFCTGCGNATQAAAAAATKPAEVIVTTPTTAEVTDYQDFTGRLDSPHSVEIRARVSGYVKEIPFKEGDEVHEGDLLFQIDPLPYQADLNQAEANLNLAMTDQRLQEKNADRARRLQGGGNGTISQEEVDQVLATLEKAKANVGAVRAARDKAKLYLDYTRVTAPFSGRVSRRFVDPGNLIKADDTLLTTLVAENAMFAYFDVDERTYLGLPGAAPSPDGPSKAHAQLPVLMTLATETEFQRKGAVDFTDNRVNASTGTIRMRGVFPNPEGKLKAGMFVRIRLPLGQPYKALLIPDEALMSDQGRKYVYVVNAANQVVYRPVHPGQALHGLRVIKPPAKGQEGKEGLAEGERVIVVGMQRVKPKAEVSATLKPAQVAGPPG